MLTDPKVFPKLRGLLARYMELRYYTVAEVEAEIVQVTKHLRYEPSHLKWKPARRGAKWGDSGVTAWFRGDITLPPECDKRKVFIRASTGGESLFLVDGRANGVFDGNHPVVCLTTRASAGATHHLAFEAYAGHTFPGTQPFENGPTVTKNSRVFGGIDVVLERREVTEFCTELLILLQLAHALPENSLRRGRVQAALANVFAAVEAVPDPDSESWLPGLRAARRTMSPLLKLTNGPTTPTTGIVAASHIDTAWLWPVAETWRKCARTFSSALNLMEQYPEMIWLQPAPCHAEVMRQEYPELFERMKAAVKSGRWEPNGAMWVEPDANMPSGEAFVRQVLVAQRWTRQHFGYTGDTLWLPDVFGYSAALPQILRLGRVEFFCTTKMAWNDTTRHPYETFHWKGIDGSCVLTNLNAHNSWPDPQRLIEQWNWIQHKDVDDRALLAYGHGDGGGGPMAEMLEVAGKLADLEGCPRARHTTLSDFMKGMRDEYERIPEWSGELYLELHRGTLTSIAGIKKGNRTAEIALREAEFLSVLSRLHGGEYPSERLLDAWRLLLLNQFHDILPGSSIAQVNDEAIEDFARVRAMATDAADSALRGLAGPEGQGALVVANSLSWPRVGELALRGVPEGLASSLDGAIHQTVEDVSGDSLLLLGDMTLPPLATSVVPLSGAPATSAVPAASSPFRVTRNGVETPFAKVRMNARGEITSLVDKATDRAVVGREGGNVLLLGEDIPAAWDNWDIDADQAAKMEAAATLVRREVVAEGPLQLRLRSKYNLTDASTVTQDMVFHSTSPRIDFETRVDWHEKRKLLKAAFDLEVLADSARHEIQYGHVERPTHRNLPQDRARFEVCAHKWTDLSENGFGVAILNDCKYGVAVHGSWVGLSLIKSGVHPDDRGDEGVHLFTYSLLPHAGGFTVPSVVRPAYELNVPVSWTLAAQGASAAEAPVTLKSDTAIIEAVKWAEDGDAFIVRLYDAGKTGSKVRLEFGLPLKSVTETNILEEDVAPIRLSGGSAPSVEVYLAPFEIKTLRCEL